jgi:MbtH protein
MAVRSRGSTGWRKAGKQGSKADCLTYIDEVWTDMRPLSLRRRMAGLSPLQADS